MPHPAIAAKTAIAALIAPRPAWAGVDVRQDPPTEKEDVSRDMFWFEDVELEDAWSMLGGQGRRASFRLSFVIDAIREGDDGVTPEGVVWDRFDDLVEALRSDYTLGGAVRQIEDVTGSLSKGADPNMWQVTFRGQILCHSATY